MDRLVEFSKGVLAPSCCIKSWGERRRRRGRRGDVWTGLCIPRPLFLSFCVCTGRIASRQSYNQYLNKTICIEADTLDACALTTALTTSASCSTFLKMPLLKFLQSRRQQMVNDRGHKLNNEVEPKKQEVKDQRWCRIFCLNITSCVIYAALKSELIQAQVLSI
jgi:hypothetical protein